LYDLRANREVAAPKNHKGRTTCLAWSAKQQRFASGGADGLIMLRSLRGLEFYRKLLGHDGEVTAVAFSPDARRIVSAGKDRTVRVWDARGKALFKFTPETPVLGIAFAPDGKQVFACGEDGIHRHDLVAPKP